MEFFTKCPNYTEANIQLEQKLKMETRNRSKKIEINKIKDALKAEKLY
jgi:hypothetical protein